MRMDFPRGPRRSLLSIGGFLLMLVFVLAACGTNTTVGSGSQTGKTPTPTATHQASAGGCPGGTTSNAAQIPANVVLTKKNTGKTVNISKGQVVEVRLEQGLNWSGPAKLDSSVLELQGTAGSVSASDHTCVWRFLAVGAGKTQLSFTGRPICKKGQMCPMYIMAVPFTIEVS
jgi:hypothetical protein